MRSSPEILFSRTFCVWLEQPSGHARRLAPPPIRHLSAREVADRTRADVGQPLAKQFGEHGLQEDLETNLIVSSLSLLLCA